ncbi:DevR family CRISPR-associated autoregulator [Caldisericum sp.]|uniref:DevR family CRISPR-associated autoregulator n=1 Tax=Caldisericum sp. TaxID=2499687 RepID=UPI003D1491F0
MFKFVIFSVKTQLNVHDLNNEAVAGNVTDIRIMEFLDEDGKRLEAPAVSGRMLKHWHLEGMKHLIVNGSYTSVPLCAGCKVGEPIRPGNIANGNLLQNSGISEADAIKNCVVCDSHGYLIAKPEATAGEGGISARRTSRAMFSWLMPVLGIDTASKQVIHNRVSSDPKTMMPFNKSYASGIYAFVSALDVDRIGLVELNLVGTSPYAINDNDRKERVKVAIEAYRLMLSGQIGASLSHAIPHQNPLEILVAYSETGPLPFPVSPMYSDYISKTIGLMPKNTTILYWGTESPQGITKKNTIDDIFTELVSKV